MELSNLFWVMLPFLITKGGQCGLTGPSQREEMKMSNSEAKEFAKFKKAVLPTAPNKWMGLDIGLMKFFTQAGKKADDAIALYKGAVKKRSEFNGYKIPDDVRDLISPLAPYQEFTDKFGRIAAFFKAKRVNVTGALANDVMFKKSLKFLWGTFEEGMARLADKHEKRKSFAYAVIVDVKDVSMNDVLNAKALEFFSILVTEADRRFPRCWHVFFVVNAMSAFELPIQILKDFMSEYGRSVFFFYGEDDKVWGPQIEKFLDLYLMPDLYLKSKDPEAKGSNVKQQGFGGVVSMAGSVMVGVSSGNKKEDGNPELGRQKKKKKKFLKAGSKGGDDDYDQEE